MPHRRYRLMSDTELMAIRVPPMQADVRTTSRGADATRFPSIDTRHAARRRRNLGKRTHYAISQ